MTKTYSGFHPSLSCTWNYNRSFKKSLKSVLFLPFRLFPWWKTLLDVIITTLCPISLEAEQSEFNTHHGSGCAALPSILYCLFPYAYPFLILPKIHQTASCPNLKAFVLINQWITLWWIFLTIISSFKMFSFETCLEKTSYQTIFNKSRISVLLLLLLDTYTPVIVEHVESFQN